MTDENLIRDATYAAWHEFRYPHPAIDEPTEAFKRAIRAALEGIGGSSDLEQRESFRRAVQVAFETVAFQQSKQSR